MTLIYSSINFLVFFLVLFFLLRKPVGSFLKKRKTTFITNSKEAAEIFANARSRSDEAELRLKNIKTTGEDFIKQVISAAENNSKNMVQEAKRYVEYSTEEAKRIVEAEERSARGRVKNEFVSMIMDSSRDEFMTGMNELAVNKYIDGAEKR